MTSPDPTTPGPADDGVSTSTDDGLAAPASGAPTTGTDSQLDARTIAESGTARRLHGVLVAVAAAIAGATSWATAHPMGLVDDDVTNLRLVDAASSVLDVLLYPVFFTQVAPGHRLLTALQVAVGPLDRVVMHALVAAMVALCVVAGAGVMRHLYGRQAWGPVIIGLVMVSPAVVQTNIWYATAYHQTPSLLFGLSAVWAWLVHRDRLHRDLPARRWLVMSVVLVGCGLAFSVRAGLAVLFMVLLEHVLFVPSRLGDLPGRVWEARRTWLPYLLPLFVFWEVNRAAGTLGTSSDTGIVVSSVARGVVQTFVPLLFGIRTTAEGASGSGASTEVVVLCLALLVLVLAMLARRRPDAVRGAVVALVMAGVGVGLSAVARSDVIGSSAGLVLRYHMEPLAYAAIALPWGLRGQRGAGAVERVDRVLLGRPVRTSALALLVGVAATTAWSNQAVVDAFPGDESARWLEEVEASAATGEPVMVLDAPIATAVQPGFPRRRFNDLGWLYDTLDVGLSTPEGVRDLHVVTDTGAVEPLRSRELFSQAGADYLRNGLVTVDGAAQAVGTHACTTSSMRLTTVVAPHEFPRFMEVEMGGAAGVRVDIIPTDEAFLEPGAETTTTATAPFAVLPMDIFGTVFAVALEVTSPTGTPTCVRRVRFLAVENDLPATTLG